MKVVGLLSGGKDSCYNLCHCVAQGHDVVAVASLGPSGGKEEIDSYLYQTVGQDGLHFIAEALGLPLFRRQISGTAVDQSNDYATTADAREKGSVTGDETEDLYELLKDVITTHPDIKGVSAGAILSNYQRIRVEHVCARLNLQALSYLWQYDQSQLLHNMAAAGMNSVIIKVAGAGLGLRHIGMNVCSQDMQDELDRLNTKWGTHPAGEGGEYETFTVDCPLFRRRIEITDSETVVLAQGTSRDEMGTIAYLRIKGARLVDKPDVSMQQLKELVYLPALLDEKATQLRDVLSEFQPWRTAELPIDDISVMELLSSTSAVSVSQSDSWIGINNMTYPAGTVEAQISGCFTQIRTLLAENDLELQHISHVNLYLSDMNLFPRVNAIYNTFFGPSPPSRACVTAFLEVGLNVKIDIIAQKGCDSRSRSALHVRGLSYWAPANIGPYSQAVKAHQRVFIAGQIALRPGDLSLPEPPSFATEVALSLQHVRRIVRAVQQGTGGGFKGWLESCICWLSGPASTFDGKRDAVRTAWHMLLEGDELYKKGTATPPFLIVQTSQLPRGAQVEWQITWHTGKQQKRHKNENDGSFDLIDLSNFRTINITLKRSRAGGTSSASSSICPSCKIRLQTIDLYQLVFFTQKRLNTVRKKLIFANSAESCAPDDRLVEDQTGQNRALTEIKVMNIATDRCDSIPVACVIIAEDAAHVHDSTDSDNE